MRKYLLIICCFIITYSEAQDLTGLWKGTLYNDTTGFYCRYEIAISEKNGKFTGFSHTWFILDDKQYYGVKKLKVMFKDGKVLTEDNGLLANNYPVSPPKNVRQYNELVLEQTDTAMLLKGPFHTNRTKEYSSLTGTIMLMKRGNYRQSALVPHLEELGKISELSFVPAVEKQIKVAVTTPVKRADISSNTVVREEVKTQTIRKGKEDIAKNQFPSIAAPAKAVLLPAEDVTKRKTVVQETVYFTSDSLQISLYDNGEVDGDTVSVLVNGEVVLAKQRLSTTAVSKSIYIGPSVKEISVVMFAENLGTIAPNSGLMVVKDGKDVYEIRFSNDLQQNAAIIFKRK